MLATLDQLQARTTNLKDLDVARIAVSAARSRWVKQKRLLSQPCAYGGVL
jgi:hypothetical protein